MVLRLANGGKERFISKEEVEKAPVGTMWHVGSGLYESGDRAFLLKKEYNHFFTEISCEIAIQREKDGVLQPDEILGVSILV